jgi:uncharacterized protein (UPF0212 family)
MNCGVVVEAAIPVYDVASEDEAVRIAISKTGDMLNPDLNYVEIGMHERACPHCGEGIEPAFVAADEALVALELEMTVFNVEDEEHAARIARKEIGQRMREVPLDVVEVKLIDEDAEDADSEADADPELDTEVEIEPAAEVDADAAPGEDDDVLPEFEDLIEDDSRS